MHRHMKESAIASSRACDNTQYLDQWQGLPYYPIGQFYKKRFGEKVYKIPVSVAETCPNREGLKGMKTCVFCDVWGSAAYPEIRHSDLKEQIEVTREHMRKKYKANKFLVYFQAYTNTFTKTSRLGENFQLASQFDDVEGFVVGTRPDCLSEAVFDLWNDFSHDHFLAVELGVQTFNEEQLLWMRRGHTGAQSLKAIEKIHQKCSKVDLGIHLIFGLPGETDNQVIETAQRINDLPIDNVKLHNLHVLKNTPLEEFHKQGQFEPLDLEAYAHRVVLFLEHLRPNIAVHRLVAIAKRKDELVAPQWNLLKMDNYQFIVNQFRENQTWQGRRALLR